MVACVVMGFAVGAQEFPTIAPLGTSSYEAVAKYLNPGGSLYAYVSTEEWAAKLDRLVGTVEGLALSSASPQQSWQARTAFEIVHRFVAECGLADLGGIGLSCVQTGEDLYHSRVVFRHGPGGAKGLYWAAFGGTNGELDLLSALPANTALANWAPCDLKPIWAWLQAAILESGSQRLVDGFDQGLQRLQAQGIMADAWLASLGSRAAVVLTIDPEAQFTFPAGAPGNTVVVPGFALAVMLEVRDDTIFRAIDAILAANPQVVHTDTASLRQRVLPFPLPAPLRATVTQIEGILILSTSDQLPGQLAAGTGGLTETPLFKRLSANLPTQGTGFTFASPAFGQALGQAMQSALAVRGGDAAAASLNSLLFPGLAKQASYWVRVNTADGVVALGNSNFDYGQDLITRAATAPLAIMAGMLLPALSHARSRAQHVSGMNNLKQIGLGLHMSAVDNNGSFPDDLGVLMEKGYVTAGRVFVSPGAGTPPPADAGQVRAGQCDYVYFGKGRTTADCVARDPLACTKPGLLGGQSLNVLYGDGHVQTFSVPPEAVQQALAKAGIAIPAPGGAPAPQVTAGPAVVEREVGYMRIGGLTLGKTLAAKHPKARVLILTGPQPAGTREDPAVSGLREGMQGMTVVATVTVPEQAAKAFAAELPAGQQRGGMLPPLEFWFTGRLLNQATAAYAGEVDLVVSTIGLPPEAQPEPWFWQAKVKVAFANGSIYDLRKAIEEGRITAAIAYNPKAVYDELPLPTDPGVAFAKRYLLITPENVTPMAAEYPDLFRR
jgi:prepilin-type processing-associated H-X9-DG protein